MQLDLAEVIGRGASGPGAKRASHALNDASQGR